jgi:hypothetical protein
MEPSRWLRSIWKGRLEAGRIEGWRMVEVALERQRLRRRSWMKSCRAAKTVGPLAFTLVGLLAVSCSGSGRSDIPGGQGNQQGPETPTGGHQRVVVTRDDDSIVSACRPASVARRLMRFSRALRKADATALREFWGPAFKWFSVGARSPTGSAQWHFTAYHPQKALRYVKDRHGLALRVEELDVAPRPGFRGADIAYAGRWMGTGRSGGTDRWMSGKGFVDCRRPTIRVWSMVVWERDADPKGHLCPEPEGGLKPETLLVCLRAGD